MAVDPRNPDITYGGCYGGSIARFDRSLGHSQEVMAWPELAVGQQAKVLRYLFQWNAPIRISPHDPRVLYHCSNVVLRTTEEGEVQRLRRKRRQGEARSIATEESDIATL